MKTVIVTGATSGIGYAICEALLSEGYPVIGIGRSLDRCNTAKMSLQSGKTWAQIQFITADLMQQSDVLRAAREIENMIERMGGTLHALINNAGGVRGRYMTTQEGYEQQFALNHLSGFLLTHELMHLIRRDDSSVIFTSSKSHRGTRMNWNDLMFEKRYKPLHAYKQSKLCNMLFVLSLREMGVRACGVDPGLVRTDIGSKNSSAIVDLVWKIRKRGGVQPEAPAKIYLDLCKKGFKGIYYGLGTKERRESCHVNLDNARKLNDLSLRLCGMREDVTILKEAYAT